MEILLNGEMVFPPRYGRKGRRRRRRRRAMKQLATCDSQTVYRDQLWCEKVSEQPGSFSNDQEPSEKGMDALVCDEKAGGWGTIVFLYSMNS